MTINPDVAALMNQRLYEKESDADIVAQELGLDRAHVIDFSLNVNPTGPSAIAVAAATEAMSQANRYPDLMLSALRAKLAMRHDVDPGRIAFGCGLDEVIKLLVQAWCRPGNAVVMHVPTFPRYELEVQAAGGKPRYVSADPPWTISVPAISDAVAEIGPSLVFLCTPTNPTGAVIPRDEIETLCDRFPDTVFVVDEALADPKDDGALHLTRTRANVAVLRTFSKYWGLAGFRIGYAVAAERLIDAIEAIRPPFNVALPSAAAAAAVLDDEEYLRRSHDLFRSERAYFEAALADMPGIRIVGAASNMVLLNLEGRTAADVTRALAHRGVLVVDAQSYRGLESADVLRVSLRTRAENEALIGALKDVLQ